MFIYIFFCINYFCVFSPIGRHIRGLLQIREFIGSLIVVCSPIDHARVMSMKVKIVIIFLG